MSPRRRGRQGSLLKQKYPDRGPVSNPPPNHPACGSAQCRVAHASRGPHRRDGAACSRWYLSSARCTYQPVRSRRMPVVTPTASGCAWRAGSYPHNGRCTRGHGAPRRYWRYLPLTTTPPYSTSTLATGRAPPGGPGPRTPLGDSHHYAAQGPHRGLPHVPQALTCLIFH